MEYLEFTQYDPILLQGAWFSYGTQIIVMVCEQIRQYLHMTEKNKSPSDQMEKLGLSDP